MKLISSYAHAADGKRHGVSRTVQQMVDEYQRRSGLECIRAYLQDCQAPCEPLPERLRRALADGRRSCR